MSRYVQRYDGDVIAATPSRKKTHHAKIRCCDCGLVHVFTFATVKDERGRERLFYTAKRDVRATAASRRKKKP